MSETVKIKNKQAEAVDVAKFLRDGIVKGRFMPNERLIEIELAKLIGTNRANIRTALARLEQEGLVTTEPNRGARVRLIGDKEAIEIIQARAALESLVAYFAALRATKEQRQQLRDIFTEMEACHSANDFLNYSSINDRFHSALQAMANHDTASKLLGTLRSQVVRFQYKAIFLPGRADASHAEHREIVEAVCSGEAERAEAAMKTHLSNAIAGIEQVIAATGDGYG